MSEISQGDCFFVTPIGPTGSDVRKYADNVLRFIVRPVCSKLEYSVTRADEIAEPGSVTSQILRALLEADVIIADLTGTNPNVMYELAIAHTIQKPTIQLASGPLELPFDVQDQRTIQFDIFDLESVESAKGELEYQLLRVRSGNLRSHDLFAPVRESIVRQAGSPPIESALAGMSSTLAKLVDLHAPVSEQQQSLPAETVVESFFSTVQHRGMLINPADQTRHVTFLVETFSAMLEAIANVLEETGTVGEGDPADTRLVPNSTTSPSGTGVLFQMGQREGQRAGKTFARFFESEIQPRSLSERISMWCRFDSDSGFGVFKEELDIADHALNGTIALTDNFLTFGRGPSDPHLCSFLEGYIKSILAELTHWMVKVTHISAECEQFDARQVASLFRITATQPST